jgi:hypothetical protein
MNYAETILARLDREIANTRKVLERVPEDKLDWQAHPKSRTIAWNAIHLLDWQADPKSRTIGWNAIHLAEILGFVDGMLTAAAFDIAPVGGEPYQFPKLRSPQEILDRFDRNAAAARKAIAAVQGDQLTQPWSLLRAGTPLVTLPRATWIRRSIHIHLIHHRAILCVYLRLNDIPVPEMDDPSGDE